MDVAIVGLPGSGKSTVFNAVTRGAAQVAGYGGRAEPNVGVAKVPDERLDALAVVYQPKRVVQSEVSYVDLPPPPEGFGETRGISGEYLNRVQTVDVLVIVARAFEDESVLHVDGSVDALRDAETMLLELSFADLEMIDRRLVRLSEGLKGARAAERDTVLKEQQLFARLKERLEAGEAMREASLAADEERALAGFGLLSAKPVVVLINIGEEQLGESSEVYSRAVTQLQGPMMESAVLCGSLEMDLAQMESEEEIEMRDGLGLGESGLDRMIALSHKAADVVTFFTGNDNEVHAWTAPRGTEALSRGRAHTLGLRARLHPGRGSSRLRPAAVRQHRGCPPTRAPSPGGPHVRGAGRRRAEHPVQRVTASYAQRGLKIPCGSPHSHVTLERRICPGKNLGRRE